jgi:hypothetical protein
MKNGITVKGFIKEMSSALFSFYDLKEIPLEVKKQVVIHNKPMFYGTVFNIAFDYSLFCKGVFSEYSPKYTDFLPPDDDMKKILKKIKVKKPLNDKDFIVLEYNEEIFRSNGHPSAYLEYCTDLINDDDITLMHDDMPSINQGINDFVATIKNDDTFIRNPLFNSEKTDIYGDGDFIMNDVLFEIKCVAEDGISIKTQEQLILYKLINDLNGDARQYQINKFGYYNPRKGQLHIWDAVIPPYVKIRWEKFLRNPKYDLISYMFGGS